MSNHIAGNWFVSVFKLRVMSLTELAEISCNKNYRKTTRRNAASEIAYRGFNKVD